MNPFMEFWNGLDRRGRYGFGAGLAAIVVAVAVVAALTLRTTWGTLFSGLGDADMATLAAELDKMKVPYRVSDDDARLMVPEAMVHKTRLALMGRELPLHGAVGFELFNNVEFGTSDFVQKVNYQRALQGELTRTILSIDEVQSARVHLALPEQTLFRKDDEKAKASVTVVTKPGRTLAPAQVLGIQRLVGASVQQVQAQDVTVLDQHGVPLSRAASAGGTDAAAGGGSLDAKADAEKYLARKATEVLDRTFGQGIAVVSVDAVFAQENRRVTIEEVLPAHSGDASQAAAGVVVKERQSVRGTEGATGANAAETTNSETEYQVGRRTEQVTTPAGALRRLEVAVVVRRALSDAELQRVREIVSASVGFDHERGDVIAVHAIAPTAGDATAEPATAATPPDGPLAAAPPATQDHTPARRAIGLLAVLAIAACLALAAAFAWLAGRRRATVPRPLTEAQRSTVLQTLQIWLEDGAVPPAR